jgi:hypothetical protein
MVKGAPYTAESVSESVQRLVDGNRISRKSTSVLYRDSEGRTRHEQRLEGVGPWASGAPRQMIMIHDPVAQAHYILEPETKTARKMMARIRMEDVPPVAPGKAPERFDVVLERRIGPGGPEGPAPAAGAAVMFSHTISDRVESNVNVKTENLGTQTIEGLACEGTRTTSTVAAGQIGNDRPLETVTERWVSKDLGVLVMSKTTDPRFGETSYRLTNVRRGEQPRSLFEIPPDYTVKEDGGPQMLMRKVAPGANKD